MAEKYVEEKQKFFRQGSDLNVQIQEGPIRVVFYVTRGRVPSQPQGKAAGVIIGNAIDDFGLSHVMPPVVAFLIRLDWQDKLISTPELERAPVVCEYAGSFKILGN